MLKSAPKKTFECDVCADCCGRRDGVRGVFIGVRGVDASETLSALLVATEVS